MEPGPDTIARAAHEAAQRIAPMIRTTPLERSAQLSKAVDADVLLKLEHRQYTGSFKLRGAVNRVLTLTTDQLDRGCVAASSGNHGAAVAYALQQLGKPAIIFVPEQTSSAKVTKIQGAGADVRKFGTDGLDTEEYARRYADDNGLFYVSPYNDAAVVAGQGTLGVELLAEAGQLDAVFVAVGGGGLVSGVGSVLKAASPDIRIIGCQPAASPIMQASIAAGRILDLPSEPTLSDGTAGGIEADSITFPLCRAVVDEFVVVDEAAIAAGMRQYMAEFDEAIEGAAGVAIAALLARPDLAAGGRVAVIVCGGNVSDATLAQAGLA